MGNDYIISVERNSFLSIDTGRLKINSADIEQINYVAVVDIAVLLVSAYQVSITSAVFKCLSKEGAIIIFTDDSFMPTSICLPLAQNLKGSNRPFLQAKIINSDISKNLWDQVIKSKILGQINVLQKINQTKANYISNFLSQIQNGDEKNIEGFCAKIYWECFFKYFNSNTTREKQNAKDVINSSLNYAYAIIRSIVARTLCGAGLCLNFGIGHSRKDNPFNLAEDFIEPFRFIADNVVFDIFNTNRNIYNALNPELKNLILRTILKQEVVLFNTNYRLFQAIDKTIYSFCNCMEKEIKTLILPNIKISSNLQNINNQHIKYES